MREYLPILIIGGVIGTFTVTFLIAYFSIKNKKEELGFDRNMGDGEIARRLLYYGKAYWKDFVPVFLTMLLSTGHSILSPLLVGHIEELVKNTFQLPYLFTLVAIYGAILLISLVCNYFQAVLLQKIGQKILSQLRMDTFTHIERLSHQQLNSMPVGKLVTRVTNDTNAISMMFTNVLVTLVKNSMVLCGILISMLAVNYALALLLMSLVPFVVLFTVIFRKFSRKAHRAVTDSRTDLNTYLSENLSGMKIIQIFNREEEKMADFQEKSRKLAAAKKQRMLVFGTFRPLINIFYGTSVLLLIFVGTRSHIREIPFLGQTITSGMIVTFYMYASRFYDPIQSLAEQFDTLQSAFASAEKIFTILDMEPEVVDAPDAIDLPEIRGEIEFKDVWFAYKPGQWVLQGVSFRIEARQTVAFVGATGSGKTTILSLLCRNYDIQKGQILLDGIDIRKIKIASLRRHFGQMLQDVFLFSGTIRSNILLRKEGVSDEEVMEACRYVNAASFINKLEAGLDEPVRERGNNFSAGQRQLLSFARTIVHKPAVMILDEATANIDTETELLIQDSLERMKNIGTMLIVAHRLSTIQHADNIILLSKGKIVEQGTHQQLLHQRGGYYHLYTLQHHKEQLTQT